MRSHMRSYILPKPACYTFSAYNGIFKITYAKIMPHMQKFAYMPHISACAIAFFSVLLPNVVLRLLNILAANDYRYLQTLNKSKSKMSKLCRKSLLMTMIMILRHSNLHMPEICEKIHRIYAAYVPYICAVYFVKFCIFSHIFCLKKFRIF